MPGELEIISRIRQRARATPLLRVGIGDDAAVIKPRGNTDLIACCDLMVEDVHFRRRWGEARLIGRKSLAVTLSDVAAMGGSPLFAMVSLALPGGLSTEFVDRLLEGVFESAERADVSVIGGDTSSSPGPLFIDTTVIGECEPGRAVTRAGASEGDRIFVTGSVGSSALGLLLLERGHVLSDLSSPADWRRDAILKHLDPEPRSSLGRLIGESGIATAMIDISDGLTTDLSHILEESGCGAVIDAEAIPVADTVAAFASESSEIDPVSFSLGGGEEYELLFTARPAARANIDALAAESGIAITEIGEIVAGKKLQLKLGSKTETIEPSGYEHEI